MVFYVSSPAYQQVILKTIQETDNILEGCEISREMYVNKYIKENLDKLIGLEHFILDLDALQDTDDEIIEALEMLRIMASQTRIIILAPTRPEGDELLKRCFQMSIYDMINTDDFNVISEELKICITAGKQYKDALRFKQAIKNQGKGSSAAQEVIRQVADRVTIGFAGAGNHIGTTHNAIILSNYLRNKGYMVALVESNLSGAFKNIQSEFDVKTIDNYFAIEGVDYYPDVPGEEINTKVKKAYNFIIVDFGCYHDCNSTIFQTLKERIIISGSKPWEVESTGKVLKSVGEEMENYHYYFNFTRPGIRREVKSGMGGLPSVHFLEYTEDPFTSSSFPEAEVILKDYLPVKIVNKKGFFKKR